MFICIKKCLYTFSHEGLYSLHVNFGQSLIHSHRSTWVFEYYLITPTANVSSERDDTDLNGTALGFSNNPDEKCAVERLLGHDLSEKRLRTGGNRKKSYLCRSSTGY